MDSLMRLLIIAVSVLLCAPAPAMAAHTSTGGAAYEQPQAAVVSPPDEQEHPSPATMAADALLVRPLGVAATAIGAAVFIVSLPFSAVAGDVGESAHVLIVKPAKMTFSRPLGHFDQRGR